MFAGRAYLTLIAKLSADGTALEVESTRRKAVVADTRAVGIARTGLPGDCTNLAVVGRKPKIEKDRVADIFRRIGPIQVDRIPLNVHRAVRTLIERTLAQPLRRALIDTRAGHTVVARKIFERRHGFTEVGSR